MSDNIISKDPITEKLLYGRLHAVKTAPYYRKGLFAISINEVPGLGTFATDEHWRLYYDPQKVEEWTVSELGAVWLHELEHLMRNHAERFKDTGEPYSRAELWNIAADAGINADLKDMGATLPSPEVRYYSTTEHYPGWKRGDTTESLYSIARDYTYPQQDEPENNDSEGSSQEDSDQDSDENKDENQDQQGENGEGSEQDSNSSSSSDANESPNEDSDQSGDSDSGDSETDSDSSSSSGGEESGDNPSDEGSNGDSSGSGSPSEDENEQDSQENGGGSPSDASDKPENAFGSSDSASGGESDGEGAESPVRANPESFCGSGADGAHRDYNKGEDPSDGSLNNHQSKTLREEVAKDIIEYEKGNPGSVPGNLKREAEIILAPQANWKREIARDLRMFASFWAGQDSSTYSRPSRRSQKGIIFPGKVAVKPPEIAVVLDTSGSMSKKDLGFVLGECNAILKRIKSLSPVPKLNVINCDVGSADVREVNNVNQIDLIGGGGTDMRVGIKVAAELRKTPDLIITATDGYTPFPREPVYPALRAKYIVLIVTNELVTDAVKTKYERMVPDFMKIVYVSTKVRAL